MMTHRDPGTPLEPARLTALTKALGDPSRLAILRLLSRDAGEFASADGVCVCDLVEQTGLIQSLVSYHMRILREAGLVRETRRGKWTHYRLDRETARQFLAAWEDVLLPQ